MLFATIALFAASVAGLVTLAPKGKKTPAQQLAKLQAFVNAAKSVHYVAESTTQTKGGHGDLGSSFSNKSKQEGDIAFPNQSHSLEQDGTNFSEVITLDKAFYERSGESQAELRQAQWIYSPHGGEGWSAYGPATGALSSVSMGGGPIMSGALSLDQAGAHDLADMLRAASTPKQVSSDVIEVSIDIKRLPIFSALQEATSAADAKIPTPTVTAQLTSGPHDELERLMFVTKMEAPDGAKDIFGSMTSTDDIHFTKWGEPVTIAKPSADTVDPTPGIDEKGLAEFHAMPLLAPRKLPAGFELTDAQVVTSESDASVDDGNCPEVSFDWADAKAEAAFEKQLAGSANPDNLGDGPAGLEFSLTPASCDNGGPNDGAKAIKLGKYSGTISHGNVDDGDYANTIEVIVGATRVEVDSDLPLATVVAAASDFIPFDLATQPVHHVPPPQ
ncbi:MAG: hypothetical protein JO087_08515 [Actinobacteria bacterium]|nr:hypothetical protein [Actinomycetota bacterium]